MDSQVFEIISKEAKRQSNTIELIASENHVSSAVTEAVGSCFTNKYAEGYPGKRYYFGCDNYDEMEILAQERAKLAKTEPEDYNDIIIEQLKSDGSKLRTWTLVNSFIRSVNYGDLDYSSDDLVSLEIVIGYDFCKIE